MAIIKLLSLIFDQRNVVGDGKCLMRSFLKTLGYDFELLEELLLGYGAFLMRHSNETLHHYRSSFKFITDSRKRLKMIYKKTLEGECWPSLDMFYPWAVKTAECNICVLTKRDNALLLTYVDAKHRLILDRECSIDKNELEPFNFIDVEKTLFFYLENYHFSPLFPKFKEEKNDYLKLKTQKEAKSYLDHYGFVDTLPDFN